MLLNPSFPGAFGLDIGDLSIKLVQLSYHESIFGKPKFKIHQVRSTVLPPGYIVNGEIQQPEMVRRKILQLLGKEGPQEPINSPWVVSDLPEPKTFLKLIDVETPADQLTDDDVAYQARKHLPFEIEDTYLDWEVVPTSGKGGGTQVLIGAVPKLVANTYTYLLESVDLNPLALEIEAMSIARAMITANKDYAGEARAILDLGATRSCLIIYDRNSIQFSINIDFSGELITTAISQNLKLDYEESEKLKIKNGLTHDQKNPRYLKIVTDLIDELGEKIRKAMLFYKDYFPSADPITHVTMCGGLSRMVNIDEALSRKLHITAQPGQAWKNVLTRSVSDREKLEGLSYSSAIGLAIRASQEEKNIA